MSKKDKKQKKKEKKKLKKLSVLICEQSESNKLQERRSPDRMSDAHVAEIKNTSKELHEIFVAMMILTGISIFNAIDTTDITNICIAILVTLSTLAIADHTDNLDKKVNFKRK